MKKYLALSISIILNGVLLGWIVFLLVVRVQQTTNPLTTNSAAEAVVSARSKVTGQTGVHTGNPSHNAPLYWRQVESEDYKQYIVNLRSIGCPEKTIREIIVADMNDLFASRRTAITSSNRYEYWRATPVNVTEEQQKLLQELDVGKIDTLRALGVDSSDFANLAADYLRNNIEAENLELDFLSESKRQRMNELRFQKYQQAMIAGEGSQTAVELEQETESAINAILTSEELHEYELRTSLSARELRVALNSLAPTEQEFRSISRRF